MSTQDSGQSAVAELELVTVEEIALLDLSSVAFPIFVTSTTQPDPDFASQAIVERVRALTANHPKAAICCDSGRSFRHEINETYKANRPERNEPYQHQCAVARERLAAEGYPVWSAKGFEADDLIATATSIALGLADTNVLIFSADKDLLQLVGPRVRFQNVINGLVFDEAAVVAKLGVRPNQICDYLSLVGDASDNVKGAHKVGPVTAADLLKRFGTLSAIYDGLARGDQGIKPAVAASLKEFAPRADETRSLIVLRTDVEIPFAELDEARGSNAAPLEESMAELEHAAESPAMPTEPQQTAPKAAQSAETPAAGQPSVPNGADSGHFAAAVRTNAPITVTAPVPPTQALAVVQGELAPPPAEFEKQLEPRSIGQAAKLADAMHRARLFNGYGTPDAVLSTIMAGRELGLPAIGSLRGFHIVEGRHMLAADLIRALVLRSGLADYFKNVERTPERATFKTHRKDDPDPDPATLTYTVEEGRIAFGIIDGMPEKLRQEKEAAWAKSGWGRNPADMCVARAGAKLARLVYPEVVYGLYCREEMEGNGN